MTQMQIEQLTQQEYTHYLAFGEPVSLSTVTIGNFSYDEHLMSLEGVKWTSTLDSMTLPGMTFGYFDVPLTSTAV